MTRSRNAGGLRPPPRPFDTQQLEQEQEIASEVARIMEAIKAFDQDKVTASVYVKSGNGIGPWKWADDVGLPPDFPAMMQDMRERFGPGDYELRVTALGRIRANSPFSIAKERTPPPGSTPPAAAAAPMGMADILSMMMAQAAEARREAADQRREAADAAARSNALLIGMVTAVAPALIPVFTRRETPTSTADMLALVTAMQAGKGDKTSLKDMVETLAVLKTLTEPNAPAGDRDEGGSGFDLAEILGDGRRLVGPAVRALADMVTARPQAVAQVGDGQQGGQVQGASGQLTLSAPGAAPSRYRVLDLVRTDVVYFFQRGFDPEKAADLVYDVIDANIEAGVITAGEINEIAAAFALSPTGLFDLAAEGIDLTSRPDWAAEFFQHLATIHNEATQDLGGGDGGAPDLANNGQPGPPG